jgi:hypothetical protein
MPAAIAHGLFGGGILFLLYYYWFQVADRGIVFLYGHMGAEPFDQVTTSRYWMTGLIACGILFLVYTLALFLTKKIHSAYRIPDWRVVAAVISACAVIVVPACTLIGTEPHLPYVLVGITAAVLILGIWIGIYLSHRVLTKPGQMMWVGIESWGVVPPLLLIHAIEIPSMNPAVSGPFIYALAGMSIVFQIGWLSITCYERRVKKLPKPNWSHIYLTGLFISYTILPLVHYLCMTPLEIKYITTAQNFFSLNLPLQAAVFLIPAGITWGIVRYTEN